MTTNMKTYSAMGAGLALFWFIVLSIATGSYFLLIK